MTRDDRGQTAEALAARLRARDQRIRRLEAKYDRTRRSLESVQRLFPQFPIPFFVVDADGTVLYASHRFESLVADGDVIGRSIATLADEGGNPAATYRRAIESGQEAKGRMTLGGIPRECVAQPVRLADGREASICLLSQAAANAPPPRDLPPDEALQAEKLFALGELISGVAHELNNPLTGLIGFSELLSQRDLDTKAREMVTKVVHEAHRCKRIVANLLSFSRKHPDQRSPVNVCDLVQQALELMRYELRTANILVNHHMEPNVPMTIGDPYLLQQVFFNIIRNACQAMAEQAHGGTLSITTSVACERIQVRISDTGPGIPEELRARVFEAFFTTKPAEHGTGLGLSISHKIIHRHGGSLAVDDSGEKGATFVVTLPIKKLPTVKVPNESTFQQGGPSRQGNILVVDDEQAILDLLTEILRRRDHVVTVASKASEALRVMSDHPYDCIISDVKMPGIDGQEFLQLIQAMQPDMIQRLIFITGDYLSDATAAFVRNAGIPYLKKPFSPDEILSMTQRVLARRGDAGVGTPPS